MPALPEQLNADGLTSLFATLEISHFISLGARAQYEFDSGLYLYGTLAWGDLEVDTTFGSGSTDEVGAGAGIGYDFSERIGAEFSYSVFDETDVLLLGLKFKF